MASPGDRKGQRRGSCGHAMANFYLHDKCARCCEKSIGEDDCVLNKSCVICDGFSESQREMLATPIYRIRKDKKAGILVSPKDVKVISTVDSEPTFQSPSGAMAQVPAQPPSEIPPIASSSSAAPQSSYVTADQFTALSDKWAEQFARMEALLSRGKIFSTPVTSVKPMDTRSVISTTPFIPPATHPTGPVEVLVAVEVSTKPKIPDEKDKKKKSHKSRKHDKSVQDTQTKSSSHRSDHKAEKKRDRSESPVKKHSSAKGSSLTSKAVSSSGPESGKQPVIQKETSSLFSSTLVLSLPVRVNNQLPLFHPVTGSLRPELSHRIQALNIMICCQKIMRIMMIETGPESCQALMTDNYQILQKPQNRQRKCPIGKQSGQCVAIWAGITSLPLKPLSLSRINPTIPGKGKTLRNRLVYQLLCRQTTGYVKN